MSDIEKAREQGVKEGQIDALLAAHTMHLEKINGTVERFLKSNDDLAACMRELASEIRTLQEGGRLAEERVRVAASTLADETERRREELAVVAATGDRKFTKGQQIVAIALALIGLLVTIYLARNAIPSNP